MNLKDMAWWIWFLILSSLGYGIFVNPSGFVYAIALQVTNLLIYSLLDKNLFSFSSQIRWVILVIFLAGQIPGAAWVYWIPFVGLSVRELTGYCLMARLLSLLPWNRKEPFTLAFVKRRIFSPPTQGSILNA